MRTILPLGVLLALSLVGCSSSNSPVTGPAEIEPSIDPARGEPLSPCQPPVSYQEAIYRSSGGSCQVLPAGT